MPTRVEYPEGMPGHAAAAHHALSAVTRLTALRYLAMHPDSTRAEVREGSDLTERSVRNVLEDLEHLGYIVADFPPGQRRGRNVRYRVNRDQLARDLMILWSWTMGV
ncbi:helix-turn-helix transcriptional regulator [Microbacterium sediminicola]